MVVRGTEEEVLTIWAQFRLKHPWKGEHKDPCVEHMSITRMQGDVVICFQADNWEWYSGYEDVDRINTLWAFFYDWYHRPLDEDGEQTTTSMAGIFLRIGEDNEDVEQQSFNEGYDLASLNRSISSDYSVDLKNDLRSQL